MTKENNSVQELAMNSLEEIEGYEYCDTTGEKCMNDCWNPLPNAFLSDIE